MTSQQRELILSQRASLAELRAFLHAHSEAGTEQQRQAVQLYLARCAQVSWDLPAKGSLTPTCVEACALFVQHPNGVPLFNVWPATCVRAVAAMNNAHSCSVDRLSCPLTAF